LTLKKMIMAKIAITTPNIIVYTRIPEGYSFAAFPEQGTSQVGKP